MLESCGVRMQNSLLATVAGGGFRLGRLCAPLHTSVVQPMVGCMDPARELLPVTHPKDKTKQKRKWGEPEHSCGLEKLSSEASSILSPPNRFLMQTLSWHRVRSSESETGTWSTRGIADSALPMLLFCGRAVLALSGCNPA